MTVDAPRAPAGPIRRSRREASARVVFVAAVGGLVVSLAGVGGAWFWGFDLVSNFRSQLAVLGLVLLGVSLVLIRRPLAVAVAAAVLVLNLALIVPLATGRTVPPDGVRRITVAHVNMQSRPGDVGVFVDEMGRSGPDTADVFVVLEPFAPWVPLPALRPLGPLPGSTLESGWVFSRLPIVGIRHPDQSGLPAAAVEFTIDVPGAPVRVLALHTTSPYSPGQGADRDRALDAVVDWRVAQSGRVIVVGDFNATPWSAAFRSVRDRSGLEDSEQGFGVQPSFPDQLGRAGLPIDHALHTADLVVTDRRVGPAFGSLHKSLFVTYAMTGVPA